MVRHIEDLSVVSTGDLDSGIGRCTQRMIVWF